MMEPSVDHATIPIFDINILTVLLIAIGAQGILVNGRSRWESHALGRTSSSVFPLGANVCLAGLSTDSAGHLPLARLEICSKNEDVCLKDQKLVCKSTGDGTRRPSKTCQLKDNPDVGDRCSSESDCPSFGTYCYTGGDSDITGTCQTTVTIEGKTCKNEKECDLDGCSREKTWSNFGAYDGVNGGWGLWEKDLGFICSSGKCEWISRSFSPDTTKGIDQDEPKN